MWCHNFIPSTGNLLHLQMWLIKACLKETGGKLHFKFAMHIDAAILHNNIKSNNILVKQGRNALDLIVIVIDFGKAIHEARAMSKERDPVILPFLAPELNKGQRQSTKSDIFLDFPHFKRFFTEAVFQTAL